MGLFVKLHIRAAIIAMDRAGFLDLRRRQLIRQRGVKILLSDRAAAPGAVRLLNLIRLPTIGAADDRFARRVFQRGATLFTGKFFRIFRFFHHVRASDAAPSAP